PPCAGSRGGSVSLSDPNPRLLHDPEPPRKRLAREDWQRPRQQAHYGLLVLRAGPEHKNAGMLRRWIRPDVREIEVERDQCPLLSPDNCTDQRIGRARQRFILDRVRCVTRVAQ